MEKILKFTILVILCQLSHVWGSDCMPGIEITVYNDDKCIVKNQTQTDEVARYYKDHEDRFLECFKGKNLYEEPRYQTVNCTEYFISTKIYPKGDVLCEEEPDEILGYDWNRCYRSPSKKYDNYFIITGGGRLLYSVWAASLTLILLS